MPDRLTPQDLQQMSGHIATVAQMGVPLAEGLRAISKELPNGRLRRGLLQIVDKLERGVDLQTALESQGAPADLCTLIRTGVSLGQTESILHEYILRLQYALSIRAQIILALTYPLIVLAFAALFLQFLFGYIVPTFKKIFDDFGTELPNLTRLLIFISDFLVASWPWLVGGAILVFVIGPALFGLIFGKAARRRVAYMIPLIGPALRWTSLSAYAHLLAFLMERQVPLPEALQLAGDGAADANLRETSHRLADAISEGESVEAAAARQGRFPAVFVQAISGQTSPQTLAQALHGIGDLLQQQARLQATLTQRAAAPLLILATVVTVGFVVLGTFMPLIKLLNDLS